MKQFLLCLFVYLSASLTAHELEEKLFAVHATNFFPQNGVIRAGFGYIPFEDPLARSLYPDARDTVHFALGEVVRGGWDNKRYAVLVQLKYLLPQVINVNVYDTFTLGSVPIDHSHFILVVPQDDQDKVPPTHHYAVWTYDSRVLKIRQAVDAVIHSQGGWAIRMEETYSEDVCNRATHLGNDADINTPAFFSPLNRTHPHVCCAGLRWVPYVGEGYLFGQLERSVTELATYLLSGTFSTAKPPSFTPETFEAATRTLQCLAEKVDRFVACSPYSPLLKKEYENKRFSIQTWITIASLEIELNKNAGKTLYGAPKEVWQKIDTYRHCPAALKKEGYSCLNLK